MFTNGAKLFACAKPEIESVLQACPHRHETTFNKHLIKYSVVMCGGHVCGLGDLTFHIQGKY